MPEAQHRPASPTASDSMHTEQRANCELPRASPRTRSLLRSRNQAVTALPHARPTRAVGVAEAGGARRVDGRGLGDDERTRARRVHGVHDRIQMHCRLRSTTPPTSTIAAPLPLTPLPMRCSPIAEPTRPSTSAAIAFGPLRRLHRGRSSPPPNSADFNRGRFSAPPKSGDFDRGRFSPPPNSADFDRSRFSPPPNSADFDRGRFSPPAKSGDFRCRTSATGR